MRRVDPERSQRIRTLLEGALEQRQFGSAAWAIVRPEGIAASGYLGGTGPEGKRATRDDSLYDLASLTKPVATAASVLYLLDRGLLLLGDLLSRYFPEAAERCPDVTIRHLLTHTSGLPPYAALHGKAEGVDAVRRGILAQEPSAKPGEKYAYSCLGYILLQNIVARVSGQGLDAFAREQVHRPLSMRSTTFLPSIEERERIAAGGRSSAGDRRLIGEVHDPLASAAGGVSGNAGLFSTLSDVCRFASLLLNGAELEGVRLFSRAALELMLTNQVDPSVGGHSLGFFAHPNEMLPRGDLLPLSTVGHTGFTGTSLTICREVGAAAVLLTNCLYHGDDKSEFFRTRRLFHTLVGAAVACC